MWFDDDVHGKVSTMFSKATFYKVFDFLLTKALVFMCLQYESFENTAEKKEIARNEQFCLFPECFLPFWRTVCNFHQIENCRLQNF